MSEQESPILKSLLAYVNDHPDDAEAMEELANLLAEKGDVQQALLYYQRILSVNPEDIEAQVNRERLAKVIQSENSGGQINFRTREQSFPWQLSIPVSIQILISIISFILTLILAELQQWQATDLVWSLWISSLVLGFSYLLTGIISNAIQGVGFQGKGSSKLVEVSIPLRVLGAVFFIVFFTIHFGMFHYVHSIFLNLFFPLVDNRTGFPNLFIFLGITISRYWPVIIFSAVSQLPSYLRLVKFPEPNFMMVPYKNVIKMHISIFVFAGLSFTSINQLILPYLLILYFFPFGAIRLYFTERKRITTTIDKVNTL